MDVLWWIHWFFVVLIGLAVGSFLNVAIERIPADASLWRPSACDVCGNPVRIRDNVPVFSYLWLRGKCRDCGTPIPPSTPWIEALGGLLAALAWVRFVPDGAAIDLPHRAGWAVYFVFLAALVVASFTDIRHRIIPDQTSIFMVPLGIIAMAGLQGLGFDGWPGVDWRLSVLGASLGGLFFSSAAVIAEFVLRREGLGWGDVKLVAMIGAFLGPRHGLFALLIGCVVAVVFGLIAILRTGRSHYLPFGPSLALGAAVWLFYGDVLTAVLFPRVALWR